MNEDMNLELNKLIQIESVINKPNAMQSKIKTFFNKI